MFHLTAINAVVLIRAKFLSTGEFLCDAAIFGVLANVNRKNIIIGEEEKLKIKNKQGKILPNKIWKGIKTFRKTGDIRVEGTGHFKKGRVGFQMSSVHETEITPEE